MEAIRYSLPSMFVFPSKDRLKKWLSSLLIFLIFASQTLQIPLSIQQTFASGSDAPNLVSIIVSASTNSGSVKSRIKRYANDIQAAMTNTRVVIVEVADNVAPHSIAALNEKLYYEGDGNGISRLVGTVLIGKLPLPVVHKGTTSFLSIYPYTDFDDKVFIFDPAKGYYEAADAPVERDNPEIWHGVIQPNTGNSDQDSQKLLEYLDKTHDFYLKQGVFANTTTSPYVFYLDVVHDQKAASAANWKAYNLGLDYVEDITYNRFNKYLAKTLYEKYQGFQDASQDVDPAELAALGITVPKMDTMDFSSSPDVQTRTAVTKVTKQFFEVFNEKYIGDILKFVYNTGRYGDGTNTRADIAPVLASKRDEFMKRVLKDSNTAIEGAIDGLVKNGLSQDLAIPVDAKFSNTDTSGRSSNNSAPIYQNYYYGTKAASITSAKQCSIVRGSTLPVEANRGYNIMNVEPDIKLLSEDIKNCFPAGVPATGDYWGGNSPINLSIPSSTPAATTSSSGNLFDDLDAVVTGARNEAVQSTGKSGSNFQLKTNRYRDYVVPTFDLLGQSEITAGSGLKVYSPSDCLSENFIADPYAGGNYEESRNSSFYHPKESSGTQFRCIMRDSNGAVGHKTYTNPVLTKFYEAVNGSLAAPRCTIVKVDMAGVITKEVGSHCDDSFSTTNSEGETSSTSFTYGANETYDFKKIPSWIEHKSPTDEEYGSALKGMTTPSLASDHDRYIDFIGPKGATVKIEYPNFFRMNWKDSPNLSPEEIKTKVKEELDKKSQEINALISAQNPSGLNASDKKVYDLLKSGEYPAANVDLYKLLSESGNALSTLVDTLVWYNQSNATSKYAFILENYLDRDGNRDYPLAGHHDSYEMGYIGGLGDAQNLYVKVDPESKNALPKEISDIQGEYSGLMNLLDGANMGSYSPEDSKFRCGPPEGVPIWQWLPAVFCWLGTILPPTIGAGSCGPALSGNKLNDSKFFTDISTAGDGKPDWQKDDNKNGIPDGYEWVSTGRINLSSPLKRIGYRASTTLTADLIKNDRILAFDSYNEVAFDVKKIVLKKGQAMIGGEVVTSDKVVYARGGTGDSGSLDTLKKYVFFTPIKVRAEAGTANYVIQSIDRDVDVYLEAVVAPKDKNGQVAFSKNSNELVLEVRSEALKITPTVKTGNTTQGDTSFKAGTAESVSFAFGITNSDPQAPVAAKRPVEVKIYDDVDGTVLQDTQKITTETYTYNGDLLKKSGNYRFEFIDADNRFGSINVNVLAADPVRIDAIASSSLFVKGQKNMILIRAMDAFGNIAKGNLLQIQANISGGGFFTENNDSKLAKSSVEGTASFEMSANDGGKTHTIKFSTAGSDGKTIEKEITVKSIDYAKIRLGVPDRNTIVAGSTAREVTIEVTDKDGKVLDGFNGIASIDYPQNSGAFSTPFVQIQNGKNSSTVKFTPGTVALVDGKVDLQVPGIRDIEGGTITVLPDAPMRVGLLSDTSKLEAKAGMSANITAQLFDRYGNLAYNHEGGLQANFKIPTGYGKYGSVSGGSVPFANGIAKTQISASNSPGTLYYSVEVTPGLEKNSFSITDESGAKLVIKGYSKNVSYIESYYLWNAEKLKKTNYNVLSTTLVGADYGNVTVPNYLAGELIFNTDSSSMAVTTLLNDAQRKSEIVQMTPGGKLITSSSSLAKVQLGSNKNRTTLDLFDPFKRENIGRFYLNTKSDTPLYACESSTNDDLDACDVGGKDSYMVLKGIGSAKAVRSGNLSLTMDGVSVFEIAPDGTIRKYPGITVEADGSESKNLLSLSILSNGTKIGRLGIKWNANQIAISSPDSLDSLLASNPGTIVYEGISPRYGLESNFLGNSSYGAKGVRIFAQSEEPQTDRDLIGSSDKQGFEEYAAREGIGFGDGNNTQLEFASQASVGEAAKSFATYSEIVIGDPVARLPELLSNQNYDRTLGKRLISGKGGVIESYSTFDYNHDGMEDIAVFYEDGKVELLQNYKGTYKSLGYLLYVVDAGPERKAAADFNGDGFGDIIMADAKGKLIVIENHNGKFVRAPLKIVNEQGAPVDLQGSIMQIEIFDMDRDGKMDLVISDDSGELNILYGGGDNGNIVFTKKLLDSDIGLKIGTGSLITGGAIRYAGIKEIAETTQSDYLAETNAADKSGSAASFIGQLDQIVNNAHSGNPTTTTANPSSPDFFGELDNLVNDARNGATSAAAGAGAAGIDDTLSFGDQIRLLDSKIYYQQTVRRQVAGSAEATNARLLGAIGDDPENPGVPNQALADQINAAIQNTQSLAASGSVDVSALAKTTIEEKKTYLRSEFADGKNIVIAKKYLDVNGNTLQAGDAINVTIDISNTDSKALTGVSYLDSYEKNVFQPGSRSDYTVVNGSGSITSTGSLNALDEGEFDYQFDGLSIPAKGKITIKYSLMTNAISVGKFHVGLLEPDDQYGDVSMNANAVCGEQELLWKTIPPVPRTYTRTLKDIEKHGDTAGTQKGKFTDWNNNGSPDYIDLLSGTGPDDHIMSSLWDPSHYGILVFREVSGPNGLDGTNFEIGRIVADQTKGYVQLNPVSEKEDIPALSTAALSQSARSATSLFSGTVDSPDMVMCGAPGTITSNLVLKGFNQSYKPEVMNDITGNLTLLAIGTSSKLDDKGNITSSETCKLQIGSQSNPTWNGKEVTGLGWKILTKSTFKHFSLAGTQSDIINTGAGIPDSYETSGNSLLTFKNLASTINGGSIDLSGMSNENVDKINSAIDTVVQGLGCGFGGGSCLALPMNWAPLAPGGAPVVLGYPTGPMTPNTGVPVFSSLTGIQTMCGNSPCCIPSTYPVSPLAYVPGPFCGAPSAGGMLGTWAPTNTFRFFITPTITGAVGVAACFGGPAIASGNVPPLAVSPLVPGGNCVVGAKPLLGCKDDGTDGTFQDLGSTDNGTLNAGSCKNAPDTATLSEYDRAQIRSYVQGNTAFVKNIVANATGRGNFTVPSSPLLTLGGRGTSGTNYELSIDPSNIRNFDRGIIQKIKNERVSAFPDFIMDWVNRQLEEVANKLTSLPTLYIIKPDFRGALDTQWTGFTDKLTGAYGNGANQSSPILGNEQAGRSISGVKAAYEFMSRLPLIKFEKTTMDISYPDVGREDLEKALTSFKATKAQWEREIANKKKLYENTATKDGVDKSVLVRADALVGSIDTNIRTIEGYKKWPEKLGKYLTWKERYASQLLCNITAIQNMLDGFITKNAIRFKAWVEFFELLKNILKGWQIIPQLFYANEAECGVCRNERYDAKHFMFKLIKAVIPPLPTIKFPKWPDIVLDLHSVRLGLRVPMPEFVFHPTPIVLPQLPNLALPGTPSLGINLPSIPTLPELPPLPNLPDLPSLPVITLPELPPPPTIPKLFGAIKFTLNILKIVAKVLCIMRTNPFVPEWRAGDQIAQITERQGKLKLDFLNIEFPQFNASFVDAIKVTTFVNFEFQIDFLLEMAKSTFEPVNSFSSNLSNLLPNMTQGILPGKVDLQNLNPGHLEVDVPGPTGSNIDRNEVKKYAQTLAGAFITTIQQGQKYANEEASYEDIRDNLAEELTHVNASPGTPGFAILEEMKDGLGKRGDTEADELAHRLRAENNEKFELANGFVKSEIHETTELQAKLREVELGKMDLAEFFGKPTQKSDHVLAAANAAYSTESELPDFTKFNERAYTAYSAMNAASGPNELTAMAEELTGGFAKYTAEAEKKSAVFAAGTSVTDEGELAQYEYRGIYAMDNDRQIRLFDYTNDLLGSERAIPVNRLGNGAIEYVYQSGDALYLKTKLGNSAPRPASGSVSTLDPDDILDVPDNGVYHPTAPNHFMERFASSGEINFGFRPADFESESLFRLEFYDYIDRFDRLMDGQVLPQITPSTRAAYLDLVPELENETVVNTSTTGLVLRRPYAVYGPGKGESYMTGPTYRILKAGEKIRIAADKSIYADGGGARIRRQLVDASPTDTSAAGITSIPNSGELKFLTNMDIEVLSGNVVLIEDSPSVTPRLTDLSQLKGMPVIVGQKIEITRPAARLDLNYYNGASLAMNGPAYYESYDLGQKSDEYQVSFKQDNAWYYAKLQSVSPDARTSARITLLSPQTQADKEPPLIQVGGGFRAPVYLEQQIDLRNVVSDSSEVTDVYVDTDLTKDSDDNGKKDDDRDSDASDGILRKGSSALEWYVKPQDSLWERKIKIWAKDENGNVSGKESKITIYAPVPNITSLTGATIRGAINETLQGEPVDILRFRNGKLTQIGNTTPTGTGGSFENTFGTASGIVVKWPNGSEIAKINEHTGNLTLSGSEYRINTIGATENAPMRIQVQKGDQILYSESVALSSAGKIETVSSIAEALTKAKGGVGVKLDSSMSLVKNPGSSPTLPGGVFITNSARKGMFGIAADGNVYLVEPGLKLEYRSEQDYIVLDVRDARGNLIGTLYYVLDAEYVIK